MAKAGISRLPWSWRAAAMISPISRMVSSRLAVESVPVGALHQHQVRLGDGGRVVQDGAVVLADVPGVDQPAGGPLLRTRAPPGRSRGCARRHAAERQCPAQPPGARGTAMGRAAPRPRRHPGGCRVEQSGGPGAAAVLILRVPLLQPRRVLPEDLAQVPGGLLGVDGSAETLPDQERQAPRVVQVGVAQDHRIDGGRIEGEGLGVARLLLPAALDQAAVEQHLPAARPAGCGRSR
jgi:hypothetical protein